MPEQIIEIPLNEWLLDSPFNPRTRFNQERLEELAQSMRPPGRVHQPIVVRRRRGGDADVGHQRWEVVFGHSRKRAAMLAGLETIPAIVRDLSDEEVKVAQIVENLQREGVTPIDEADALLRLKTDHSATIEQLMEHCGKGRSYVYNRLRLAEAHDDVREAVIEGDLDAEIAQEVARRPKPLQPAAMRAVQHLPFRAARAELERRFQFRLANAPFDPLDIKLLPEVGGCDICKKRSDAEPVLLQECGPDVCMDGDCYRRKGDRAAEIEADLLREEQEAASRKASKKGAATPPEPATPAAWPFPRQQTALHGDGELAAAREEGNAEDEDDEPLTPEQEAVTDPAKWRAVRIATLRQVLATPRTTDELRLLLERELELGDSDFGLAEEVLGWNFGDDAGRDVRLQKLKECTADQLGALLVMLAVDTGPHWGGWTRGKSLVEERLAWVRRFGVEPLDVVTAEAAIACEREPEERCATPPAVETPAKPKKVKKAGKAASGEQLDMLTAAP